MHQEWKMFKSACKSASSTHHNIRKENYLRKVIYENSKLRYTEGHEDSVRDWAFKSYSWDRFDKYVEIP